MTFNNETNIVLGNKHNNEQQQQQHEHRTGKLNKKKTSFFFTFHRTSFFEYSMSIISSGKKGLMSTLYVYFNPIG